MFPLDSDVFVIQRNFSCVKFLNSPSDMYSRFWGKAGVQLLNRILCCCLLAVTVGLNSANLCKVKSSSSTYTVVASKIRQKLLLLVRNHVMYGRNKKIANLNLTQNLTQTLTII